MIFEKLVKQSSRASVVTDLRGAIKVLRVAIAIGEGIKLDTHTVFGATIRHSILSLLPAGWCCAVCP